MKKLTLKHSEAVSAAKASLLRMLERDAPPKWRALIEEQVELMSDVYWWVLHGIYNPGLPFNDAALGKDIEQLQKNQSDGTETKPK